MSLFTGVFLSARAEKEGSGHLIENRLPRLANGGMDSAEQGQIDVNSESASSRWGVMHHRWRR